MTLKELEHFLIENDFVWEKEPVGAWSYKNRYPSYAEAFLENPDKAYKSISSFLRGIREIH